MGFPSFLLSKYLTLRKFYGLMKKEVEYIAQISIDSLWAGRKHIEWNLQKGVNVLSGGFGHSDSDPLDHSTGKEIVDGWLENDSGASILIQSVLIWLIHQIAIIAIDFAAISRLLELGWRIALAPIGVANCFEGGASSPAIKYLKGILAGISGIFGGKVKKVPFRLKNFSNYLRIEVDLIRNCFFIK